MVCNELNRPLTAFLPRAQESDARGTTAPVGELPPAATLLADKGYDANWFREALERKAAA